MAGSDGARASDDVGSGGVGSATSRDGGSPNAGSSGGERDASVDAGGPDDPGQQTPRDGGGTTTSDPGAEGGADAGADAGSNPSSSACSDDCDDGIDCTVDECVNAVCTHAVDADVCDPGEACDLRGSGCTSTSACGSTPDCADTDPCTTKVVCNTSLASCEWEILDADRDGYAPKGCGGDDPDDTNFNARPGAIDLCDGEDNDGDGDTDEEPEASASCISGSCPGCSIGCQLPSDSRQLLAPAGDALWPGLIAFDLVHSICTDPSAGSFCPITNSADFFSSDCDSCLTALAECAEPCNCVDNASSVATCHACLCDQGCVEAFEACAGIDHPAECN